MTEAISVKGIYKAYHSGSGTVNALSNVSLSVDRGEIFGLLGPNGAGKTTLISMLIGILSPDSGTAKIFGKDCMRETKEVQSQINIVSGFSGAIQSLSVEEALNYYSMLYNVRDRKQTIEKLLKRMGIYDSRNWPAEDLSSGMRQRYFICKGLLNNPKLLILDEPTVGLDVESAIEVRKIVRGLKEEGRTILLTTHNMFEAEELCDRIAFISKGKIITTGTPKQIKGRIAGKRMIEIHCSEEKCVAKGLEGLAGVKAIVKSQQILHVEVDNYGRMKELMKRLISCKGEIFSINEIEPNFEEIYLRTMKGESDD
jgi:ABC-2 type transport system ATP-binding protein